jgi:hypothetical protein
MMAQGLDEYDHNSGRKALAGWCSHLDVPYALSKHIHGDLPDVWGKHYEQSVIDTKASKNREQSREPKTATAALRMFARFCGRGIDPYKPRMNLLQRQNHLILTKLYGKETAERVLMGLPLEEAVDVDVKGEVKGEVVSDDDRPNVPFRPPKPSRKRKRRQNNGINIHYSDFVQQQVILGVAPSRRRPRACRARAPPILPPRVDMMGVPRERKRKRRRTLVRPRRAVGPLMRLPPPRKRSQRKSTRPMPMTRIRLRKVNGGYELRSKRIRLRKGKGGYKVVVDEEEM